MIQKESNSKISSHVQASNNPIKNLYCLFRTINVEILLLQYYLCASLQNGNKLSHFILEYKYHFRML